MYNYFFIFLGFLSLILGIIGVFVPVMPTTPFLIFSAFCFKRGSNKLHQWLLTLPYLGTSIREWEENHIIRLRYKIIAISCIFIGICYPIFFKDLLIQLKVIMALFGISLIIFISIQKSSKK